MGDCKFQMARLVAFAAALIGSISTAGMVSAEDRGMAVVFACISLETEFEDGSSVDTNYRAHFAEVEHFSLGSRSYQMDTFAIGPIVSGAGGGIFHKIEPIIVSLKSSRAEMIGEAIKRGGLRGWIANDTARVPIGADGPLFYVRPASEVGWGRSGLSVTEFECSQVLF
ncbi:hypothetical protein SAMN04488001_1007 [Litoreibacter albidus]|uniref:Uncharacterized protein n=2 Tax=Litoreibacter albidus TaxID=670155 RepID=A0A1H2SZJ2_9RHOB|nr:hypothetical protein SAMN04488001_1007 [Litoreibacter albidus]